MVYDNTINLKVAIDSEFNSDDCISLQVRIQHYEKLLYRGIIFNEKFFTEELKEELASHFSLDDLVITSAPFSDTTAVLYQVIYNVLVEHFPEAEFEQHLFVVYLIFFFSCKDLEYAFGFTSLEPLLRKEKHRKESNWIVQNRAIMGTFAFEDKASPYKIRFKLRDLRGYTNSSLFQLANSLNIQMSEKNLMNAYKSEMQVGLEKHPIDFVHYSMSDVDTTMQIFEAKIKVTNKIAHDVLQLPKFIYYNTSNFPQSNGSLVNDLFIKTVVHYFLGKPNGKEVYNEKKIQVDLAFAKLSLFNQFGGGYSKNLDTFNHLFSLDTQKKILNNYI